MKLAIFDMDGTLFDTTYSNYYAYKAALNKYGFDFTYEDYKNDCFGKSYCEFIPRYIGSNKDVMEKIHEDKVANYHLFLDKIRVNQKLFEMIDFMRKDSKIVLATTASRKNTYDILRATDTEKYFDLILTAKDVKNLKPNPEVFLTAMQKYQATPIETVIFEDSDSVIKIAKTVVKTVFKVEQF